MAAVETPCAAAPLPVYCPERPCGRGAAEAAGGQVHRGEVSAGVGLRRPLASRKGAERGTRGIARRQDDVATFDCRTKICPLFTLFSCER